MLYFMLCDLVKINFMECKFYCQVKNRCGNIEIKIEWFVRIIQIVLIIIFNLIQIDKFQVNMVYKNLKIKDRLLYII